MASAESGWQQLKSATRSECPKLFYNFTFSNSRFDLAFTDLSGLWSCKRTRSEIVQEAKQFNSSIDPTESDKQLKVLLQKLDQSLTYGENVVKRCGTGGIILQTKIDLPKPLRPLSWSFHLEPTGAEEMAEQILRPCLREASESQRRVESLEEILGVKDQVIQKLLDRIDSSSTDLSLIFPGISGLRLKKGQMTSKDAQKYVPCLQKFDMADWQKRFDVDDQYSKFISSGLSKLAAGYEKCPKHTAKEHEEWLRELPTVDREADNGITYGHELLTGDSTARNAKAHTEASGRSKGHESSARAPKESSLLHRRSLSGSATETESEDDFERQRTPPKASRKRGASGNSSDSDEGRIITKKRKLDRSATQPNDNKPTGSRLNSNNPGSPSRVRSRRLSNKTDESSTDSTLSEPEIPNPAKSTVELSKPDRKFDNSHLNRTVPVASASPSPKDDSPSPSTPRKLGRLKSSSSPVAASRPETPISTPRRRLGRLGSKEPGLSPRDKRGASETPSRRMGNLSDGSPKSRKLDPLVESEGDSGREDDIGGDGITRRETRHQDNVEAPSSTSGDDVISTHGRKDLIRKEQKEPEPEPTKVETADEKAQRRREELRRKITSGATVRKTRKF